MLTIIIKVEITGIISIIELEQGGLMRLLYRKHSRTTHRGELRTYGHRIT